MMRFNQNIFELAKQNSSYRKEVITADDLQVTVMSIPPQGEIGEEVHDDTDQAIVVVQGEGEAIVDDEREDVRPGHLVLVGCGTKHNVRNTGSEDLKLYTIYSSPEHEPGTIQETKEQADQQKKSEEEEQSKESLEENEEQEGEEEEPHEGEDEKNLNINL